MIILENSKTTSCLNWSLIAKDKFPAEFNDSNVREDFELLFQENLDMIKLKETLRTTTREPNQAARKFLWKRMLLNNDNNNNLQLTMENYNKKISVLFGKNLKLKAEIPTFVDKSHLTLLFARGGKSGCVSDFERFGLGTSGHYVRSAFAAFGQLVLALHERVGVLRLLVECSREQ